MAQKTVLATDIRCGNGLAGKPMSILRPLAVFFTARIVNLLVFSGAAALAASYGERLEGRPWPAVLQTKSLFLRAVFGWDASWYVYIARNGYPSHNRLESGMAFFPGFPLLIRLVARSTGLSYASVALALALAFGAAAAVLLWLLSQQLGGAAFADRSVALFAFFPGAFVFSMAYAEPMMIALALGCLLGLVRQRWIAAGICGALATATRPNAVVLVACCLMAAVIAIRRSSDWKALWAPALTLVGIASYFAFLWHRSGRLLAWLDVQHNLWHERVSPIASLDKAARLIGHLDLNDLVPTLGLIVAVAGIVFLFRWNPPKLLSVYAVGVIVLAAAAGNLGVRPRFVLAAFPLCQAFAWRVQGLSFAVLLAVSALLLATLTFLTAITLLLIP